MMFIKAKLQTTAGSQSLEMFAETLNRAHGTLEEMSAHVEYRTSTTALHGQANRAPRLSQANAVVPE